MKRKRGLVHVILALLMSMLLIVSTGCGKSGSGDSSSDKKTDKTETLADVNTIPEDGVITKEQFKTVAGENKKVQFKGTTDDGITYIWTYDCSKIQNPADQNLKIDFSEKDLDDLKKQANNANDALKMTMYGKGLICVPDLEVQLPEAWQSNSAYLVKEQSGKLARMSDVAVTAQVKEENAKKQDKKTQDTKTEEEDSSDKTAESTTQAKKDTKPKEGTTSLKMSVTSLDGDCYIIGGITEQHQRIRRKTEQRTVNRKEVVNRRIQERIPIMKKAVQEVEMFLMEELLPLVLQVSRMLQTMKKFQVLPIRVRFRLAARRFLIT